MMQISLCRLDSNVFFSLSASHYFLPFPIKTSSKDLSKSKPSFPTSLPFSKPLLLSNSFPNPSSSNSFSVDRIDSYDSETGSVSLSDSEPETVTGNGVDIDVEKTGNNSRRIRSRIRIDASLETIWSLLTDYERLADFIPGLAVSQLLEKKDNFARLFQVGQQNLAFGLKFNAKGVLDCYEKDLVHLPLGQSRDIEFKMIEGDFKIFEGKWSIVQAADGRCEDNELYMGQEEFRCILSYVLDVEPKMWLPVRLVEGRLCKEIELNLTCIREEAQRAAAAVADDALGSSQ